MKIVASLATFKGREKCLDIAVKSLAKQVDEIIVYDNEQNPNLYDNGKFYGLTYQKDPCYFFTCDDDLFYPPNYVERTLKAIEKHKCIISHHGRILLGRDFSYYRGHKNVRCLDVNYYEGRIDVAGTGVTAFDTRYFNPIGLHTAEDVKMSDIVFSLEAIKQGRDIFTVQHEAKWIKQLDIDHSKSIHGTEHRRESRQIELANEIYNLRHGN